MTILERRVVFSSGHRYWDPSLDAEANRMRFGRWASPYNHGHNYVVWVAIAGEVESASGMVINIKDLDAILQARLVAVLDQRSLNDEVSFFRDRSPSLENLLVFCREQVEPELPPDVRLASIRIAETETLSAAFELEPAPMISLTRTYEFAASHRLHSPYLSDEENLRAYGKCNHVHGHGHNYVLEVTVSGEPDPASGMLVDLDHLDAVVEREVVVRYDHRNLDVDVEELRGQVTTSENVAKAIFDRLDASLGRSLSRVRLLETARNAFEVRR